MSAIVCIHISLISIKINIFKYLFYHSDYFFPETFHVVMTNINAERTLQFQALENTKQRLMGVLCEKGKTMKMIYMKIQLPKINQ